MSGTLLDDNAIHAQAREVIAAEGLATFRPAAPAYRYDVSDLSAELFPPERLKLLSIAKIKPPLRCVNVALFPRAKRFLDGICRGDVIPPIYVELLPEIAGSYRYHVTDGFHRFHLSRALGFSQIPAIVWPFPE